MALVAWYLSCKLHCDGKQIGEGKGVKPLGGALDVSGSVQNADGSTSVVVARFSVSALGLTQCQIFVDGRFINADTMPNYPPPPPSSQPTYPPPPPP